MGEHDTNQRRGGRTVIGGTQGEMGGDERPKETGGREGVLHVGEFVVKKRDAEGSRPSKVIGGRKLK